VNTPGIRFQPKGEDIVKLRACMTFAVALGLLIVPAASVALAQDVTANYVPGTDFSKYRTYKWVVIEGAEQPDQIVDVQIKTAVDSVLSGKGFKKVTGDTADLFVGYQVAVQQERQWNAYGGGGLRWGGGMGTATSSTISIGTLVLDMYDPSLKQLVWKGQATKTLSPSKDPEKNQQNIQKAMAKLLKEFPPTPKK
jgi:hypothetical protein